MSELKQRVGANLALSYMLLLISESDAQSMTMFDAKFFQYSEDIVRLARQLSNKSLPNSESCIAWSIPISTHKPIKSKSKYRTKNAAILLRPSATEFWATFGKA
jgi:hypothetical protein